MANLVENLARRFYEGIVTRHVSDPLTLQRIKMLWYGWGYWRMLLRPGLLAKFLRVDWHVLHCHSPEEISIIAAAFAEKPAGDIFVEAGCWNGGGSCKFSLLCRESGYGLHVFDSFRGVEDVSNVLGEWDYSGQYKAAEDVVAGNLRRYGDAGVCELHPGWFKDTVARGIAGRVAVCYIDCDTAKGTLEVLEGVVPSLSENAVLFSQDYHIAPVFSLLNDPDTWQRLNKPVPKIARESRRLARLSWPTAAEN